MCCGRYRGRSICGRRGEWGGVGVIRRGVEGEHDEAFAIAPVDVDLADAEERDVAARDTLGVRNGDESAMVESQ